MRSRPDAIDAVGRSGRGRRIALVVILGWVVGVCLLVADGPAAEESRFIPWRATAPPALDLRDLSGRPHTLADYRGQVVLINFWATWCEFCTDEIASMMKLQEELGGRPLVILSVNYGESPPRVREYARRLSANVRVLLDSGQEVARAWRVRVIPSSFLVDADGRVRYSVVGNLDWASEESVKTVRALFP